MKNLFYKYFLIITLCASITTTSSFSQEVQHQEKRTTISDQNRSPLKNSELYKLRADAISRSARDDLCVDTMMRSTQMWYF